MSPTERRPRAPRGLSAESAGIWRELVSANAFEAHELPILASALTWRDRSTAWLAESERAAGRERSTLRKQALDAATASLRHFKALKFTDPSQPARRPGRPSGQNWNAARKQEAARSGGYF